MPRFDFAVEPSWGLALRPFGVVPGRAFALVENDTFTVRFGHWLLCTPLTNVAGTTLTGPYAAWRVLGPRLSLADRGVTFGTNPRRGVCVRFHTPVPALLPVALLGHPDATLTVADPEGLARALEQPSNT
ncbi:hypothetical protein OHA77_04000 [Streptosporangium sp. NBC_01639]|uniref:hypothetical protein n=1 Tax=Streptosporangium sp. NBC_01639 TaxID=2975948 RepID=UPI003863C93F|nr:hypothetical protein OHA77_04000 [Streptosporangium sp. NBC_01639]